MRRIVLLFLMLMIGSTLLSAGDVKLAWDPSISSNVAGYKIYIGKASRTYWSGIDVGNVTTYTVQNLAQGIYFFAATAYSTTGQESEYSNEISDTILGAPFSITSQVCSANWYGVVCQATTSQKAAAVFRYQKLGTNGWTNIVATPTPIKTQHRAVIYFDKGNPTYYNYQWHTTNSNGTLIIGAGTFRTK